MGIRIHQPDFTCFVRPKSLIPGHPAEACVKFQSEDMDAHSNNPAVTVGGVLHLHICNAVCCRYRRLHRRCHTHPAIARWPVELTCGCLGGRWPELSYAAKSALGGRWPFPIHQDLFGLALGLADICGTQGDWLRPGQNLQLPQ